MQCRRSHQEKPGNRRWSTCCRQDPCGWQHSPACAAFAVDASLCRLTAFIRTFQLCVVGTALRSITSHTHIIARGNWVWNAVCTKFFRGCVQHYDEWIGSPCRWWSFFLLVWPDEIHMLERSGKWSRFWWSIRLGALQCMTSMWLSVRDVRPQWSQHTLLANLPN